MKDEKGRTLKWGDEVEYIIVKLDHKVSLSYTMFAMMMRMVLIKQMTTGELDNKILCIHLMDNKSKKYPEKNRNG